MSLERTSYYTEPSFLSEGFEFFFFLGRLPAPRSFRRLAQKRPVLLSGRISGTRFFLRVSLRFRYAAASDGPLVNR